MKILDFKHCLLCDTLVLYCLLISSLLFKTFADSVIVHNCL